MTADDTGGLVGALILLMTIIALAGVVSTCSKQDAKDRAKAQLQYHECLKQPQSDEVACRLQIRASTGILVDREDVKP